MKNTLFIAVSKDGFVAPKDHSMDWLNNFDGIQGDAGYENFYNTVNCIVMGSKTYEIILSMRIEWPYKDKDVYVLSSRKLERVDKKVSIINASPKELNEAIKGRYEKCWVLGGPNVVKQYLAFELLDGAIITTVDAELEDGIKLFTDNKFEKRFTEINKRKYGRAINSFYIRNDYAKKIQS